MFKTCDVQLQNVHIFENLQNNLANRTSNDNIKLGYYSCGYTATPHVLYAANVQQHTFQGHLQKSLRQHWVDLVTVKRNMLSARTDAVGIGAPGLGHPTWFSCMLFWPS